MILSCVLFCLAVFKTQAMPSTSLPDGNHQVMDQNENFHLYWVYDDTTITFEIIAKTTGYVGLGWSPKGGMANGDIIIASVDGGRLNLTDCHGQNRNGRPNCAETQDLMPKTYREEDGWTVVMFMRKLDTCEKLHDLAIMKGTMRVIWAMGKTDIMEYHGSNRGTKSMHLLGQKPAKVNMPPDVKTVDLIKNNFAIPDVETHYECEIKMLPPLKDKHHVIQFEPIITQPEYVHHIVMYTCHLDLNRMNMTGQVDNTTNCFGEQNMRSNSWCLSPLFGWAVGATGFIYPQHTGVPIGTEDEPHYVRIEVHYNNLRRVRGLRDSSGIRLYYTPTLRKYDAGLINMGRITSGNLVVPPGQSEFVTYTWTAKSCTEEQWGFGNYTETNAFAIFLHSHYAGVAIKHRHFRDGVELPPLADDPSYDFNFQQSITFPKEVTIKPGDQFLIECTYSTIGRTNATLGGFGSLEEMCLTYTYIYPRIPLQMLLGYADPNMLTDLYHNRNLINVNFNTSGPGGRRSGLESNIRWTDGLVEWWQDVEKKQWKHGTFCRAARGNASQQKHQPDQYPPLIHTWYNPPPSPCDIPKPASANVALPTTLIVMTLCTIVPLLVGVGW